MYVATNPYVESRNDTQKIETNYFTTGWRTKTCFAHPGTRDGCYFIWPTERHILNNGTLLHKAAFVGEPKLLRQVLKRCQPQEINLTVDGYNALHVLIVFAKNISNVRSNVRCALKKNTDVEAIVDQLESMNFPDEHDLVGSIERKKLLKCVKLLLAAGIDLNQPTNDYSTAILMAAEDGLEEIVRFLLDEKRDKADIDYYVAWNGNTARKVIEEKKLYGGTLPEEPETWERKRSLFRYLMSKDENNFVDQVSKADVDLDDGIYTLLQLACVKNLSRATCHLLNLGADFNKTTNSMCFAPLSLIYLSRCLLMQVIEGVSNSLVLYKILDKTIKKKIPGLDPNDHEEILSNLLRRLKDSDVNVLVDYCNDNVYNFSNLLSYTVYTKDSSATLKLLDTGSKLGCRSKSGQMAIEGIEERVLRNHLDNCISDQEERGAHVHICLRLNYKTLIPAGSKYIIKESDMLIKREQNDDQSELDVVNYIARDRKLRHLMLHPLILCLLLIKRKGIRNFAYLCFVLSLLNWILLIACVFTGDEVFWIFVRAFLMSQDAFQMLVFSIHHYLLFRVNKKVNPCTIANMGLLLSISGLTITSLNIAGALANDVWLTISLLIANLKFFSTATMLERFSIYVIMLKIVLTNFLKYLAFYSILIVTFATGFFLLFRNKTKNPFFSDWPESVFRTYIMLTGDFGLDQISFADNKIWSHLLFTAFVLVVALTLYNLINGLAITDIQEVRRQANILVLTDTTKMICWAEKICCFYEKHSNCRLFRCLLTCVFRKKHLQRFGHDHEISLRHYKNNMIRLGDECYKDKDVECAIGDWLQNGKSLEADSQSSNQNNLLLETLKKQVEQSESHIRKIEDILERVLENQETLIAAVDVIETTMLNRRIGRLVEE